MIKQTEQEGNREAAFARTERWSSKVYFRTSTGFMVECDLGELTLDIDGGRVRGRHAFPSSHDVEGTEFQVTPRRINLRTNTNPPDEEFWGVIHQVGGQEFYVGRWRGPFGHVQNCLSTLTGDVGTLAEQAEATWVATKVG